MPRVEDRAEVSANDRERCCVVSIPEPPCGVGLRPTFPCVAHGTEPSKEKIRRDASVRVALGA
jgi:hypothetical protein